MQQQASDSLCMSEPNHEVAAVVASAAERKWMRPKDHIAVSIAVFDKRKEKKEEGKREAKKSKYC